MKKKMLISIAIISILLLNCIAPILKVAAGTDIRVMFEKKSVVFNDLFEEDITKSEVITTFQALLELMKKQIVKAMQTKFEDVIYITLNEDVDKESINMQELKKTEEAYG